MNPGCLMTVLLVISLPIEASVLSFHSDDSVYAGPLERDESTSVQRLARLQRIGEADKFQYAVDRSGRVIGVCRTTFYQSPTPFRAKINGNMDLSLYNVSGDRRAFESQGTLLRKIDGMAQTKLQYSVAIDDSRYMNCYHMGSSNRSSRLVVYLEPKGFEHKGHFAVEVQAKGKTFSITDFEMFDPEVGPTRVVARTNPLKGNSIEVVDGQILVNGEPVLRHGKPLDADSVKYQFK
jgi:hypothetical protein